MNREALSFLSPLIENLEITADHPDFQGHFPSFQLLPAVSQIDLVLKLLAAHFAAPIVCNSIQRAKFKAMLRPATQVKIEVESLGDGRANWSIKSLDTVYSQGTMTFARAL